MSPTFDPVLVTGAASGIGAATAARLGAAGHTVICTDLAPPDRTVTSVTEAGGRALALALDVGGAEAWSDTVRTAQAELGPILALVNVAGHGTGGADTVLRTSDEAWDRVMRTNVRGAWYGMRALIPTMIEHGGGRIVNVSSAAGLIGVRSTFCYSASKGAVIAMTRQAAVEYGPQGITCNVVAPGPTASPALRTLPKDSYDALAARNPQHRIAEPSEIAGMIAFLCSDEAGFVTGAVVAVDGGTSIYGES
jgi:NAD(P)-dependent dehydrogenase (short-subunit alcohol dehydrogenase family)